MMTTEEWNDKPTGIAPELKPCPFCGESAAFEQIGNRRQSTIVACTNCGARHECGEEWGHGASWNTRTDLSQAAFARAEKAEADRDEWRKTAITKIEMADSTAFRDNDATITTLQARVRELESVFSHLYGQAVWLRGDQAYRDFARAFIKRMSALRIKCVSRQELAKIEGKTE